MATVDILSPSVTLKTIGPPPVVGPTTKRPTRPTQQIPQSVIVNARNIVRQEFDPARHLNYVPPKKIISMADIGLEGAGISDTAVSEPFSLFTDEAIAQIRAEMFSEKVLEKCQFASSFASNMIRGYDERQALFSSRGGPGIRLTWRHSLAPFTFKAWYSPEVAKAVSEIAGIDLVPVMPYEIGHCNISVNNRKPDQAELERMRNHPGESMEAFAWHRDSYPFVCVTMLSDCSDMVGGETVLRTGDGRTMKVRGPSMGSAVVLQGRYIEHQALKAFTGGERISMITPWRPRSPLVKDEIVLTTVRPISYQDDLYPQFAEYRLQTLIARLEWQLAQIRRHGQNGQKFDLEGVREFLGHQGGYINDTLAEMFKYED
ncbi:uncharacterized protein PV07_09335 [Cladophialophora immunda]|uniref:Fe2OG dioxygenase domain-containing protein n=1 Tax=Cladophialophora immunda TaxID=569365 RepID=A0A0D2AM97_9EURO|nr:uncharacterized protein PV07_09335 [Cladophialophora immunda]KIW26222.1 hypothetical protein PV07_09335 [Cladophialophora immunda]OQU96066.1 hypothetical protein CLAIMM_02202 [Cladophialophora immunda]